MISIKRNLKLREVKQLAQITQLPSGRVKLRAHAQLIPMAMLFPHSHKQQRWRDWELFRTAAAQPRPELNLHCDRTLSGSHAQCFRSIALKPLPFSRVATQIDGTKSQNTMGHISNEKEPHCTAPASHESALAATLLTLLGTSHKCNWHQAIALPHLSLGTIGQMLLCLSRSV